MKLMDKEAVTSADVTPSADVPPAPVGDAVVVRRRTIDTVLIAAGVVVTVVLLAAGALLTWGSNFAEDYVADELSSQNIFFPDAAVAGGGRPRRPRQVRRRTGHHRCRGRGLRQLHQRTPARHRRRRHLRRARRTAERGP